MAERVQATGRHVIAHEPVTHGRRDLFDAIPSRTHGFQDVSKRQCYIRGFAKSFGRREHVANGPAGTHERVPGGREADAQATRHVSARSDSWR